MRLFAAAISFVVLGVCAGCVAEPAPLEDRTAQESLALDLDLPTTGLTLEIDGSVAASLTSFAHGNAKLGDVRATFNLSETNALLDWLGAIGSKETVHHDGAIYGLNAKGERRRVDFTGLLLTEVSFPALDAKDGKKHLEVTVKFKPEEIKYSSGGGKLSKLTEPAPLTYRVSIPGIPAEYVVKVEPTKLTPKIVESTSGGRLPTQHYASWSCSDLRIEFGGGGGDAAAALAKKILDDGVISEAEFVDVMIDLLDASSKVVATMKVRAPKKSAKSVATATLEFMVEEFSFKAAHQG